MESATSHPAAQKLGPCRETRSQSRDCRLGFWIDRISSLCTNARDFEIDETTYERPNINPST